MKKLIFLLLVFSGFVAQAQFGNVNRRNQRQGQYPQDRKARKPNFNAKKYLGFINYDIDKAVKKTGVKKNSDVGKKFITLLKKYNNSTNQIERINSFTVKSMKELIESTQKKVMDGGDPTLLQVTQKKAQESFRPIAATLLKERADLDKILEELLSKKQYKKWQKFDKKSRR